MDSDIAFDCTWTWTCYTCRDPKDPDVPGAYGVGDTLEEVQLEASLHDRDVHRRAMLKAVT